jgi:hypothetical protein
MPLGTRFLVERRNHEVGTALRILFVNREHLVPISRVRLKEELRTVALAICLLYSPAIMRTRSLQPTVILDAVEAGLPREVLITIFNVAALLHLLLC